VLEAVRQGPARVDRRRPRLRHRVGVRARGRTLRDAALAGRARRPGAAGPPRLSRSQVAPRPASTSSPAPGTRSTTTGRPSSPGWRAASADQSGGRET
jgi:hypothetical protein